MVPIPFPVPSQLWPLISKWIASLAQNAGGTTLHDKILAILGQNKLQRDVKAAIERAYGRFQAGLPDQQLISVLIAHGQDLQQPSTCQILAKVAATPMLEEEQVRHLAREFAHAAPHVAEERLVHAARFLITSMHTEMATIPELMPAIMMLYNRRLSQAIAAQMPLPPFASGLREALEAAATRITTELRQGYVTSAHLLYALTTLARGVAPRVLAQFGVTETTARQALEDIIKHKDELVEDPMTKRAEETFVAAQSVARSRCATSTRSEHVLIALLESHSVSVIGLFEHLGVPSDQVYNSLLKSIHVESALRSFARMNDR